MKVCKSMSFVVIVLTVAALWGCIVSKDAEKKFESRTGPFSVTVFPVNVYFRHERKAYPEFVETIVDFLKNENIANAVPSEEEADITFKLSRIQSTMARRSGLAFAKFVKNKNIKTDYALLVDLLMTKSGRSVSGVHVYLVDKDGKVASFGLTNSKWEEFQQVRPTSREKGVLIATMMMKRLWGKK